MPASSQLPLPGEVSANRAPPESPSQRYGFFYAYDAATRRMLLYSGAQGGNPIDPAQDTWALDVATMTWSRLADGPTDFTSMAVAADDAGIYLADFLTGTILAVDPI